MTQAFAEPPLAAIEAGRVRYLFLEDVRAYREQRLAAAGRRAVFPLWQHPTAELAASFLEMGFEATIVCVDPRALDGSFAGRRYEAGLLPTCRRRSIRAARTGSSTHSSRRPLFCSPIVCTVGAVVERDGFVFCDLLPA